MIPTLFGVPLGLYGMPCLILAVIWLAVWPRDRAPDSGVRRVVLRWGHAVVWFLLALAAFAGGAGQPAAGPIALAALVLYIIFLAAYVTSPRPQSPPGKGR